jgi:hypothetical protein
MKTHGEPEVQQMYQMNVRDQICTPATLSLGIKDTSVYCRIGWVWHRFILEAVEMIKSLSLHKSKTDTFDIQSVAWSLY